MSAHVAIAMSALITLSLLAAGCGEDTVSPSEGEAWRLSEDAAPTPPPKGEPEPEPVPEPEQHPRFVGTWLVQDGVARGGISAEIWEFRDTGDMEMLYSFERMRFTAAHRCSNTSDLRKCMRGEQEGLRCDFGDRWASQSTTTLIIDGECSDGRPRKIVWGFSESPAQSDYLGEAARLLSVGGQIENWHYINRAGGSDALYFQKCDTFEDARALGCQ